MPEALRGEAFTKWIDMSGGDGRNWKLRPGAPADVVTAFEELQRQMEEEGAELQSLDTGPDAAPNSRTS